MPKADVWIIKRRRKRGDTYAVRWKDPTTGRMRCESVGRDRKLAKDFSAQKREELRQGINREPVKVSWDGFAATYVEQAEAVNSPEYAAMIRRDLDLFKLICEPRSPLVVDYRVIADFVRQRLKGSRCCTRIGCQFANTVNRTTCWKCSAALPDKIRAVAPTTVNRNLRVLRAAFNNAKKRYRLPANPFDDFAALKSQEKPIRALKPDEQWKVLEACPDLRWRTFIYLALTTGMRRGELCGLTWDQVDLDVRRITLTRTKSGKVHGVRLTVEAVELLKRLRLTHACPSVFANGAGKGFFWSVGPMLERIVKAAGVARFTCHDLRRTFATSLARAGVNQKVTASLIGHSSVAVTAKYYQAVDDEMADEAIAKLPLVATKVG